MKLFIAFLFTLMQMFSPAFAGTKTIVKSDLFEGTRSDTELIGNKGHFEKNALSWAGYDDAAGTPVDGTGGVVTTTCARSTSSPIDGDGSLLMTKGAANYQGEGCALTFTVPGNMSGDVLTGTFEYAVASGTYASSDVSVWAYNVTAPSMGATSPSTLANHATVRNTFKFEFTPAYSASAQTFRLLLHIASTSANAYTLKFDNFQIHRKGKAAGLDTQIQYNSGGLLTGSSNFVWDYTNNRLGIGTTPSELLHIKSSAPRIRLEDSDGSASIYSQIVGNSTVGSLFFQADPGNAAASSFIQMAIDGTTMFTLDSSGNLNLGSITPSTKLHLSSSTANQTIRVQTAAAASGEGGELNFYTSQGTIGSESDSGTAQILGDISFLGYASSASRNGALIRATQSGSFTTNSVPTVLGFYTGDGTNAITERLQIDAAGNIRTPSIHNNASPPTNTTAVISSGTYSPTLTNGTNIASSTTAVCNYSRVGNVVTVAGYVEADPTSSATDSALGVSIPIASNFTLASDARGTASVNLSTLYNPGIVLTDTTNDRVEIRFSSVSALNQGVYFTFQYLVK